MLNHTRHYRPRLQARAALLKKVVCSQPAVSARRRVMSILWHGYLSPPHSAPTVNPYTAEDMDFPPVNEQLD